LIRKSLFGLAANLKEFSARRSGELLLICLHLKPRQLGGNGLIRGRVAGRI
jgi:hypothetical protein